MSNIKINLSSLELNNIDDDDIKISVNDDDENFLKNFLKDFYQKIIIIGIIDNDYDIKNFEINTNEWINYKLENDNKDSKNILEIMKNHQKSKIWFTSFIGFFYQFGIGCYIDIK